MFGRTRETNEMDTLQDIGIAGEFFGDEAAAEEASSVDALRNRLESVESQINSQFTSLATYAQIAQEQVELARAEARAHTERAEQRMTALVERERADRVSSTAGATSAGSSTDVSDRIDVLEQSVTQLMAGLDECLARQKQLADAIATMFERLARGAHPESTHDESTDDDSTGKEPSGSAPGHGAFPPPQMPSAPLGGPIAGLSLDA